MASSQCRRQPHRKGSNRGRSIVSAQALTQSTSIGAVAGISGAAAAVSFNDRDTRVAVRRADGSRINLDTATHRFDRSDLNPILAGYSYRGDRLLTYTNSSVSLAAVYTNWNNTDSTDYLAGGYWIHFEGSIAPLMPTGAEIGAFVDGPEISGTPTLPLQGTASYLGRAEGFYGHSYGSSFPGVTEIGQFSGDARLTANFALNNISGCIGCGDLSITGLAVDSNGQSEEFSKTNFPSRLRLGPTPIDAVGTFRGCNVTFERDGLAVTSSRGSWGGRFSNIPTNAGDPRLIAGTVGAEWTIADGGQGAVVGAWYGSRN